MYALVDCNNFYASCERVFEPRLMGQPLIVLSNNDGNVVARSEEAKRLGIGMGDPVHRLRGLVHAHGVIVRSSNYSLYHDMSCRFHAVLEQFTPDIEVYSIDEAFLRLAGRGDDASLRLGRELCRRVQRWVGIPVSVGLAPTKTLAKVANRMAKRAPGTGGAVLLSAAADIEAALAACRVGDLWGIGPRYRRVLEMHGIRTALDLRKADLQWVRQRLSVTGVRMVMELHGEACLTLEDQPPPRRQIIRSRSFGRPVSALTAMEEAVATHTSRAAEKIRAQGSVARVLTVFIATNRFQPAAPQYANAATMTLPHATDHTPTLLRHALDGLRRIYRPGYRYKKAGVCFTAITSRDAVQGLLFERGNTRQEQALMKTMDLVNARMGRNVLRSGAMGFARTWGTRRRHRSPRYTTRWDELPRARAP